MVTVTSPTDDVMDLDTESADFARKDGTPASRGPYRTRNTFVNLKVAGPYDYIRTVPVENNIDDTADLLGPRCDASGPDATSQNALVGKAFFEKLESDARASHHEPRKLNGTSLRQPNDRDQVVSGALDSIEKIERVLFDWNVESPQKDGSENIQKLQKEAAKEEPPQPPLRSSRVTNSTEADEEALRSVYAEFYAQALLHIQDSSGNQRNVGFESFSAGLQSDTAAPTSADRIDSPEWPEQASYVFIPDSVGTDWLDQDDAQVVAGYDFEDDYDEDIPPPPPRPPEYYFAQARAATKASEAQAEAASAAARDDLTDDDEVNSVLQEFFSKAQAVAASGSLSRSQDGSRLGPQSALLSSELWADWGEEDEPGDLDDVALDVLVTDLYRTAEQPEWARMVVPPLATTMRLSLVGEVDPATGGLILQEPDDLRDVNLIMRLLMPTFALPAPAEPVAGGGGFVNSVGAGGLMSISSIPAWAARA